MSETSRTRVLQRGITRRSEVLSGAALLVVAVAAFWYASTLPGWGSGKTWFQGTVLVVGVAAAGCGAQALRGWSRASLIGTVLGVRRTGWTRRVDLAADRTRGSMLGVTNVVIGNDEPRILNRVSLIVSTTGSRMFPVIAVLTDGYGKGMPPDDLCALADALDHSPLYAAGVAAEALRQRARLGWT